MRYNFKNFFHFVFGQFKQNKNVYKMSIYVYNVIICLFIMFVKPRY